MSHQVSLILNTNEINKKDVEFTIKKNGGVLGRLLISKGNVEWLPVGRQNKGHRLSWTDFDTLMRNSGSAETVRNARAHKAAKKSSAKKGSSKKGDT